MAIGRRLVRGGDMDGEDERDMDGSFGAVIAARSIEIAVAMHIEGVPKRLPQYLGRSLRSLWDARR
jgi:hypothetical protein